MRLTLRTMLAYLDDILEPDDTEDIGKKIEESEFATNLMHRTRDCMRRLRLGVPVVIGRGLGADPNSVAEYLDNKLSTDRVPEFEKICLESDVHLAEVAACHQILTLVLGEPATIDPASRQRMYQLSAQIDAPPVQNDAVQAVSATPVAPPVQAAPRRAKPEVPDYLREPKSKFWPVAAMVTAVALLTFGILLLIGPGALRDQVTALLQPVESEPTADEPGADETNADAPAAKSEEADSAEPAALMSTDKSDADDPADEKPAEPAGLQPLPPVSDPAADADDPNAPPAPEPQDADAASGPGADAAARSDDTPLAPLPPETDPLAAEREPKPDMPADDPAADARPADGALGPAPTARVSEPAGSKPPAEPAEADSDEGGSMGRYMSKLEVLLKLDPASDTWKRLPSMLSLSKGDHLLSLPAFKPVVALSSNVTIQADGAAEFELSGWNADQVPILTVLNGRLLLDTVGKGGNGVVLKLDDREALVTFLGAESSLALEVTRVLPPGKDPQQAASPLTAELYARNDAIRVREGDTTIELPARTHRTLFSGSAPPDSAEFPKWVTTETIPQIDRTAATTKLEPLLLADKSASLVLKELSMHRQQELRSLAIRGSCSLGNYDACIRGLNDKDEKKLWPAYIEELRAAVARSPEAAGRVRTAIEKQRAADAELLFRMLWGYSADDLKNGADRDLVDGLNHEALDVRVLAFWNLQNITGLPSSGYHPSDPEKKRRTSMNAWKEKLRTGKIVPKSLAPVKPKAKVAANRDL